MMPFIELPSIPIGGVTIRPFGVIVAIGILLGAHVAGRYVARHHGNTEALHYLVFRVVAFGLSISHLVNVAFYTPGLVAEDPFIVLRLWDGLSSIGGMVGGTLVLLYYTKKIGAHYLRYRDAVGYGLVLGFTIGRVGCSVAHDHLGSPTDFFLGVLLPPLNRCRELVLPSGAPDLAAMAKTFGCRNWQLPDGSANIVVHDLGLYEVFLCGLLFVILIAIDRLWTRRPAGTIWVVCCFYYAPIRFFLDYLRLPTSNPLYLGFTPAQWMCFVIAASGLATLRVIGRPENRSVMETHASNKALELPSEEIDS